MQQKRTVTSLRHATSPVNPSRFSIRWEHRINEKLIRDDEQLAKFKSQDGQRLVLPYVTYQDFGDYFCLANNGVQTRDGSVWSSGYATLHVNGKVWLMHITKCFITICK